jgi:hypothetical protein
MKPQSNVHGQSGLAIFRKPPQPERPRAAAAQSQTRYPDGGNIQIRR